MKSSRYFDFSKTESQSFLVHSVRLVFVLLVFLITLSFQFLESRVVAPGAFIPIYSIIVLFLTLQIFYLAFFKKLYRHTWIAFVLFFLESLYISGLIYFIGFQQSVLIFLYLVNLILCGVLFQRKGALLLALWTSILFSFIISLDTTLAGHTAYLAVGVNNLAFFTVAYLSGFLSEQLNFMGEQLKESVADVRLLKNLNELILKNINVGVMTVDKTGQILQTNPSVYRHLGLSPGSLERNSLEQVLVGLDLNSRPVGRAFDYTYLKNGEKSILSLSYSELYDESGASQGRILTLEDETHLRALEKRLRQSEKMAAIGGLAAGIAHEIRNPLAGISGSIQLLQAGDSDVEQSQKLMNIVNKEINRLNNLITEFLDFAKPEAPLEDHVNLATLLQDVLQLTLNQYVHKPVPVETEFDNSVVILGNKDKLKQAFLNILVNAFQAMEQTEKPKLELQVKKVGDAALVLIKDFGQGMKAETKDKIFEPFHTTKAKGTGLGLAITHSIIESHSADISVESELGVGTEFQIRFHKCLSDVRH